MTVFAMIAVPTDGDDIIEVGPGLPIAEIDAGEGDDTILLKPTAESSKFYLYSHSHKNFEIVQGTSAAETVNIHANLLASLKTFNGGGGGDKLEINLEESSYSGGKYTLDLSNVDIRNAEIHFERFSLKDWLVLKFKDKETALAAKPGRYNAIIDFSDTNVTFTLEERNQLFKNGFEIIKDASGEYTYSEFSLGNLDHEIQFIRLDGAPVFLDVNQDASLPYITPGGGSLEVSAPYGTLDLIQSEAIQLIKDADDVLHVLVDLTPDNGTIDRIDIGTISQTSTSWFFHFNENATAYGIQEIIRNLTFQNRFSHDRSAYDTMVMLTLTDATGFSQDYFSTIYLLPKNVEPLDTNQNSAPTTEGDDNFLALPDIFRGDYSLNGGSGTDTLFLGDRYADFDLSALAGFSGFERIVFHQDGGRLHINSEQLKGVNTITGADNSWGFYARIILVGDDRSTFDFQDTTVDGNFTIYLYPIYGTITLDDKSLLLELGGSSGGFVRASEPFATRIHLVGDTFTAAERAELAAMGVTDIWDDSDDGAGNAAPVISGLDGDTIATSRGETVALDVGSDAVFSDDTRIRKINVAVTSGNGADTLGISTDGFIRLLDGLTEGGRITDARTGIAFANIYDVTNSSFEIMFNANETPDRVDLLVRALTYAYGVTAEGWRREILISASDQADKTTTAKIVVTDNLTPTDPEPEPNEAPRDIRLSGNKDGVSIMEGSTDVGTLTATDDEGGVLTYALVDDAEGHFEIRGDKLVVKGGARLDFESATSHKITIKVSDGEETATKDFVIHVGDILESLTGTRKNDVLKAGIGADRINGGYGNDVLTGGLGQDVFVFDSKLGKGTTKANQNKKVNFDTITDFHLGEDKILLDNAIFKKLGKGSEASTGALKKSFFKTNKATDKNDYLIYKKGVVYYDADGSGTQYKPIEFIKIANKAALSAADFLII